MREVERPEGEQVFRSESGMERDGDPAEGEEGGEESGEGDSRGKGR